MDFCQSLYSDGKISILALLETSEKLVNIYKTRSYNPHQTTQFQDVLPKIPPNKITPFTTHSVTSPPGERQFIELLRSFLPECKELDPELTAYVESFDQSMGKLVTPDITVQLPLTRALLEKAVSNLIGLKRGGQRLSVTSLLGKIESIKTPPSTPPPPRISELAEKKRAELQLKVKSLEEQLNSTWTQVDQYKKNCDHLTELLRKQPNLIDRDILYKMVEQDGFTRPTGRGICADKVLFGKIAVCDQVGSVASPNDAEHIVEDIMDQRLESFNESHPLTNKSVIHSYLSRNPRIIKHIKGGLKKTDVLPLAPQDPPEKKWNILNLLGKLCLRVDDEVQGGTNQTISIKKTGQSCPTN